MREQVPLAAIAIGSNLDDPAHNVRTAIAALRSVGEVTAISRLYRSQPWGVDDQPQFINAVVLVRTELRPRALLDALKEIERHMGRNPSYRWGPRLIDLDIVYYDDLSVDEPGLTIPHPHFKERPFVLVPLAEIDSRYASEAAAADQTGLEVVE